MRLKSEYLQRTEIIRIKIDIRLLEILRKLVSVVVDLNAVLPEMKTISAKLLSCLDD